VLVDRNGDEDGRILYDSFGMALTNTLPLTLTGALLDVPDAATGLVHLGGGRWYDPALGRPLQPNPAGGPPTVPQALNRYAATPVGQPGVYQAAASTSSFGLWAQQQAIKVPTGLAAGKYLFEPRWGEALSWVAKETGWLRVSIQAEKRLISESLQHLDLISREAPGLGRRVRGLFQDGWRTALSDAYHVEHRIGRVHQSVYESMNDVSRMYTNVLERETVDAFEMSGKAIASDLFFGIGLDVAFQIGEDWDNPYLTPGQKGGRLGVTAGGAFLSGYVGLTVEGVLIAAEIGSGPAGWIALGAGLGVDFLWEKYATPWVYEYLGYDPSRNLAPFQ
jgi:hypothetical protein